MTLNRHDRVRDINAFQCIAPTECVTADGNDAIRDDCGLATKNQFVAYVSMMALQLSLESYTGFPSSTVTVVKPLQPENAWFPIDVTDLGIDKSVRLLHPKNASSPMV